MVQYLHMDKQEQAKHGQCKDLTISIINLKVLFHVLSMDYSNKSLNLIKIYNL